MLLPRENAHFVLGQVPILLLGAAPIHDALPSLHMPDGQMPAVDGWTLVARLTLCVVDGPGDAGCIMPTLRTPGDQEEMESISAWCTAVERTGGAVVLSLDQLPTELDWNDLLTGGRTRGGFVRAA